MRRAAPAARAVTREIFPRAASSSARAARIYLASSIAHFVAGDNGSPFRRYCLLIIAAEISFPSTTSWAHFSPGMAIEMPLRRCREGRPSTRRANVRSMCCPSTPIFLIKNHRDLPVPMMALPTFDSVQKAAAHFRRANTGNGSYMSASPVIASVEM